MNLWGIHLLNFRNIQVIAKRKLGVVEGGGQFPGRMAGRRGCKEVNNFASEERVTA